MKDVGGGGRGTRRQVNKSAICKRVCLTSSEPNSVIGLPSVGGVEGRGGGFHCSHGPPTLEDTGVFAERTGHPDAASGSHVSRQQLRTFTH